MASVSAKPGFVTLYGRLEPVWVRTGGPENRANVAVEADRPRSQRTGAEETPAEHSAANAGPLAARRYWPVAAARPKRMGGAPRWCAPMSGAGPL